MPRRGSRVRVSSSAPDNNRCAYICFVVYERLAQLDRALPSEGKAKSSALWGTLEKIEENQAIGETLRKQQNRFGGRGSIAEANGRERVECKRRQSAGFEPVSFALV